MTPRKSVLIAGALLFVGLSVGGGWLVYKALWRPPKAATLPAAPLMQQISPGRHQVLADEPRTYDAIPKRAPVPALPPKGVMVPRVEAATVRPDPPRPEPRSQAVEPLAAPAGPSPAEIDARIRAGIAEAKAQMREEQARMLEAQLLQERAQRAAQPDQMPGGAQGTTTGTGKKAPVRWFDALGDGKSFAIAKKPAGEKAGTGKEQEERQSLIPRANWAKPVQVDKVLYWDQPIIGELQTAINSDIPGEVRIKVLRQVIDREMRGIEIIPALTSIRGHQDGSARFGQQRLNIAVDQMIFPDGTVVDLPKSRLADPSGAAGVPSEVDNHYGKLALGLLFSVGFNIGTRYAAGQPTRNEQYSIEQETAREAGQAVNRAAQQIANQFRVPPTLIAKPGDEISLFASQNINFSKLPVTVR
jgi:type IV secretion system protein VirB10